MWIRAIVTWLGLAFLAIANGVFREAVIAPRVSAETAHVVSTLSLCLLILLLTWVAIPWIAPASTSEAFSIGLLWFLTTVAFEFGFGRLVAGKSWSTLLADYDLTAGRIWILVLLATLTAPYLTARLHELI